MRKASIIICAHDHLKDLSMTCVSCVLRYTRFPFELILVDDGSQDQTSEFFSIAGDKAFRIEHSGPARGRNVGMRASEGDWIVFIDNDILVHPGWLTGLISEFGKQNVGIVGGIPSNETYKLEYPLTYDGLIERYEIASACMAFPREVFQNVGYMDERFSFCGEDTDYCFRAKLLGYRVVLTPRVVLKHLNHGTLGDRGMIELRERSKMEFYRKWEQYRHTLPDITPV